MIERSSDFRGATGAVEPFHPTHPVILGVKHGYPVPYFSYLT